MKVGCSKTHHTAIQIREYPTPISVQSIQSLRRLARMESTMACRRSISLMRSKTTAATRRIHSQSCTKKELHPSMAKNRDFICSLQGLSGQGLTRVNADM